MSSRIRPGLRGVLAMFSAIVLAGCGQLFGRGEPLQHYTLGAAVVAPVADAAPATVSVGVRQPRLADYLATRFLVVRPHPNQFRLVRNHRWGGNLDREIGRALTSYLRAQAPGVRVDLVPWPPHVTHDFVLELRVLRFEAVLPGDGAPRRTGEAHLRADWELIRAADAVVVANGTVDRRHPGWPVDNFPALVEMLDEGLHALAGEVAALLPTP
jgi:uncharacterized lipoprotein YmbA